MQEVQIIEIVALVLIGFSVLVFLFSLTKTKNQSGIRKPSGSKVLGKPPTGPSDVESTEPVKWEDMPRKSEVMSDPHPALDEHREEMAPGPLASIDTPGDRIEKRSRLMGVGSDDVMSEPTTIDRKASLVYWERMCLEEEFDLFVSLHKPEVKISSPDGSSVHESERIYNLPKTGHVRVVPMCSGCNISPAYRDMKVSELDQETRAEFKVLPLKEGEYDLKVEFQLVDASGNLTPLGEEITKVTIQKKPIELDLKFMNISVSRRVPAFFSMCGSIFGLVSFVLARFGINVNEEIVSWSATISTGVAGAVMILLALMLLFKGLKPLMNEIDISFKI